jgi:DNA-binding LacI/PurR family transcriptional regulator
MHALKNLGLKYPQDVSVFGFDDFDWSELFSPRLTTIVQPSYEMGIRATEMLLQLIEARNQHLEIPGGYRIVLKAELRIRDSTAPPGSVSALTQQPRPCSRRKNHRQEKANLFWMGKHCGRE